MSETCPKCWAHLHTPLFCESCEEVLEASPDSPYRVLGVETSFALDRMSLRKKLLRLSRHLHPDVHSTAEESVRELAQRNTAELNAAYEILEDELRRADWLIESLGGPSEENERQMPQAFLMEVLEWNEAVEEARETPIGSSARDALAPLASELEGERKSLMESVAEGLSPLPELHAPILTELRQKLNAVRYLDRILHQITELRLAQESAPKAP